MGSYQLLTTHSDQQVQICSSSSSFCSEIQRGCSKSQNCLLKILRIISTVPPLITPTSPPSLSSKKLDGCNGFAIDLNNGFNVPPETDESVSSVDGGSSSADVKSRFAAAECGGGVSTVDVGKCSGYDGECVKREEEKSSRFEANKNEEIIDILQLENNWVSETSKSKEEIGEFKEQQGYMGLLIEAATLIFGDFKDGISKSECETETVKERKSFKSEKLKMDEDDDKVDAKNKLKRRNHERTEDKSSYPLVRSKRGRIQVLPNKYRDSILEPLTPLSRIRSTIVANRRGSK